MADKIKDDSLLEVSGGKWDVFSITEEERIRYFKVTEKYEEEGDYISYNEFIRDMDAKYGSNI